MPEVISFHMQLGQLAIIPHEYTTIYMDVALVSNEQLITAACMSFSLSANRVTTVCMHGR